MKKQLFDRMHNTVRKQLFHAGDRPPLLGSPSGIGAGAPLGSPSWCTMADFRLGASWLTMCAWGVARLHCCQMSANLGSAA